MIQREGYTYYQALFVLAMQPVVFGEEITRTRAKELRRVLNAEWKLVNRGNPPQAPVRWWEVRVDDQGRRSLPILGNLLLDSEQREYGRDVGEVES